MKTKQNGFTAIEGLLLLVIVGIIGFTGWYVWHSTKKANNSYNSSASTNFAASQSSKKTTVSPSTSSDSYSGWKTATFSGDNLSIKYPSSWTASTDSITSDALVQKTVGNGDLTVRLGWAADGLIANTRGSYGYKPVSTFSFNSKRAYIISDSFGTLYSLSSCSSPTLCFFAPKTKSQYKGINEDLEFQVAGAQQSQPLPSDAASINEAKQIMASLSY